MMLVYRLENTNGEGVFTCSMVYDARNEVAKARKADDFQSTYEPDPYRHPSPWDDVPGWSGRPDKEDYNCGFSTIEQLLRWFDSEAVRQAMKSLGAVLNVYEVDRALVMDGRFQIMFRRASATLVETREVPTAG